MNISKLDLKTLGKLILPLLILNSCQTIIIEEVSSPVFEPLQKTNVEYELPEVNPIVPLTYTTDLIFNRPQETENGELSFLPILKYFISDGPYYSIVTTSVSPLEYTLPLLKIILPEVKPNIAIVSKKPTVITKSVAISKPVVIVKSKPISKPVVIVKPKSVSKPVVIAKPKSKPVEKPVVKSESVVLEKSPSIIGTSNTVIFLEERDVIINKSFTIEMDQTGWLYEENLENLKFENKFYTNNKVLFEFVSNKEGSYNIHFVKYNLEEVEYSSVKINVLENTPLIVSDKESLVIVPENILEDISDKKQLEKDLEDIVNQNNPDHIYFKLAEIYFEEGLLKKSKEYYEYVYDNYPLSIYYDDAKVKMEYIIDNFLKFR